MADDILSAVAFSVFLLEAVYGGQVMVGGLHGPYLVTPGGKCFLRIAFYAHVNEHRQVVFIDGKAPRIVMVVAVPVVSRLDRQSKGAVPCQEYAGAGIENVGAPGRRRVGGAVLCNPAGGKSVLQPVKKVIFRWKEQGVSSSGMEVLCGETHHAFVSGAFRKQKFPYPRSAGNGRAVRKVYIIFAVDMYIINIGSNVPDLRFFVQLREDTIRYCIQNFHCVEQAKTSVAVVLCALIAAAVFPIFCKEIVYAPAGFAQDGGF